MLNMLFKVQIDRSQTQYFISTEVDRNTPWLQVSSGTHMVHQQYIYRQYICDLFTSDFNFSICRPINVFKEYY